MTNSIHYCECLPLNRRIFLYLKNEIRSYHKLCLADIWDSELIPEITLGAMCRQNKQELSHFLKANGLKKQR